MSEEDEHNQRSANEKGKTVDRNTPEPKGPFRVAVTGASGQFGRLVVDRLVEDPAVEHVVALDVAPPPFKHPKVAWHLADVRDPGIVRHLEGCDTVVHLAFSIHRFRPREVFDSINVGGSKTTFEAAAEAGLQQIIYASSVAAYGFSHDHPQPIPEDTPRVRQDFFAYSRAKYDVEALLDDFEQEHPEMVITRLRPVVMVGHKMDSLMGATLSRGRIPSTGKVPFPIVWEEDVADATVLAIERRAHGAFNLAAREALTARQLAAEVGMKTIRFPRWLGLLGAWLSNMGSHLGLSVMVDPAWIRTSDVPMVLDATKARRELGWQPQFDTAVEVMRHYLVTYGR